jgi:hypothetical protein
LATVSRDVVERDVELAFGVGRRRVAFVFVGESPGIERREVEVDCARGVREEELAVRSVVVDAEREELEPLGCGEGRESERVGRGYGRCEGAFVAYWKGYAAQGGG